MLTSWPVFLPAVVVATSIVAYALGRRTLGLPARDLRTAVPLMLECVGLTVLFAAFNVVTGVLLVVLLRLATGQFYAVYAVVDLALVPLSAVQALVLFGWRIAGRTNRTVPADD
jgi:hypothetical protein